MATEDASWPRQSAPKQQQTRKQFAENHLPALGSIVLFSADPRRCSWSSKTLGMLCKKWSIAPKIWSSPLLQRGFLYRRHCEQSSLFYHPSTISPFIRPPHNTCGCTRAITHNFKSQNDRCITHHNNRWHGWSRWVWRWHGCMWHGRSLISNKRTTVPPHWHKAVGKFW